MKNKNLHLHKISLYDISLIGAMIVLPILSLSAAWHQDQGNKEAVVYHGDRLLEVQSLNQDRIISISDKNVEMAIKIEKGRVRVLESDCPKNICVHMNWISDVGQTIVCVPNKILIEIRGKQNPRYHAESY